MMFSFRNILIKHKLVLIQFLTAAIAIMICCLLFLFSIIRIYEEEKSNNIKYISEMLSYNMRSGLEFKEADYAKAELQYLKSKSIITHVSILDEAGHVFTEYTQYGASRYRFSQPLVTNDFFYEEKGAFVNYYFKIKEKNGLENIGTICFRVSNDDINAIKKTFFAIALFASFIGFLLALILAFFFQKKITQPITDLEDHILAISNTNQIPANLPEEGEDEITSLSKSFNILLAKLRHLISTQSTDTPNIINHKDDDAISFKDSSFYEKPQDNQHTVLNQQITAAQLEIQQLKNALEGKTTDLKNANKALDQFSTIMDKDLKISLQSLKEKTVLGLNQSGLSIENKQAFQSILAETQQIDTTLQTVALYSNIAENKEKEIVDLSHVLSKVLKHLQSNIDEREAMISNDELPTVSANSDQMLILFKNLIKNAIQLKAPNRDLEVHIGVKEIEHDFLQFSVIDNGIGIKKEDVDKVFQTQSSNHNYIGLTLCKKIIENMGCKIWFDTEENYGTTFYFTLKKLISNTEDTIPFQLRHDF